MSLVRFANIHKFLQEKGIFSSIFDLIRIVDPVTGQLFEYEGDRLTKTDRTCIEIFGSGERCVNCSSARAYYTGEQAVKFEHIDGEAFLVISVPTEHSGQKIVVELIKNITKYSGTEAEGAPLRNEIVDFIDSLNTSATVDALTGLKNRSFIISRLDDIVNDHAKSGCVFSVALLGFTPPPLFEKCGKDCAEMVLATVGGIVSAFIRSHSDIAARYDDERFLICFPGVTPEACEEVCGRLRDRIEETVINYRGQPLHAMVNIGIASIEEAESSEMLVKLVGRRLEEAQQRGRGAIVR